VSNQLRIGGNKFGRFLQWHHVIIFQPKATLITKANVQGRQEGLPLGQIKHGAVARLFDDKMVVAFKLEFGNLCTKIGQWDP
jgi:hypothetical protein